MPIIEEEKPENIETPKEETPALEEEYFIDESNNERIAEFLDESEEEPEKDDITPTEPEENEVEPTIDDEPQEKPEPQPEKEPEPEPEPEKPIEEIIEKTTQETLKQMGVSKEEKKELEEEGFKFAWEDRGEDRPASWKEQAEETIRLFQHQQTKQQETLKTKEQEAIKNAEQQSKEANQYWDEQLKELRDEGLIPQIAPEIQKKLEEGKSLTKAERNDAGLKAQADIFEQMYNIAQDRESKGQKPITDIHHIYYRYINKKAKQPAGAKAPVSGGSRNPPQPTTESFSYEDIHGKDFEEILQS